MNKSNLSPQRRTYESPQTEAVAITNQGVLCVSGTTPTPTPSPTADGNTESMYLSDISWP